MKISLKGSTEILRRSKFPTHTLFPYNRQVFPTSQVEMVNLYKRRRRVFNASGIAENHI